MKVYYVTHMLKQGITFKPTYSHKEQRNRIYCKSI